jgi:hypothetical protein
VSAPAQSEAAPAMKLSDDVKKLLRTQGFSDDHIAAMESGLAAKKKG